MFYLILSIITDSAHCHVSDNSEYAFQGPVRVSANDFLDDTMYVAFYEAVVAIGVFGICSLILRFFGLFQSKPTRRTSPPAQEVEKHEPEPNTKVPTPVKLSKLTSDKESSHQASRTSSIANRAESATQTFKGDYLVLVVRSGRASELPQHLDRLYAQIVAGCSDECQEGMFTRQLLAALRACASARCFNEGLAAYLHVSCRIGAGETALWSILLYIAVEAWHYELGENLFNKLCMHATPSGHDFVNMVRCYVHQRNLEGLRCMLAKLRTKGCAIDSFATNRALSACAGEDFFLEFAEIISSGAVLDTIGYNTLMKLYAKAGQPTRIFELRKNMANSGLDASEVTFGILLDACMAAGDFDRAKCVFAELCTSDVKLNAVHCTTLIKGLIGAGKVADTDEVLAEMLRSPHTKPDLITYSTLVKAYADQGNAEAALDILDQMIQQDIKPDEIFFKSVLRSCLAGPAAPAVTLRTFDCLITHGLKPSTMTLSIILKALLLRDAWEEALATLEKTVLQLGIEPETRLYVQIAQACLKAHQGAVALQAYKAMLRRASHAGETLDPNISTRLLRQCAINGDHDTALKMQDVARQTGIRVEPHPLTARCGMERGQQAQPQPWRRH